MWRGVSKSSRPKPTRRYISSLYLTNCLLLFFTHLSTETFVHTRPIRVTVQAATINRLNVQLCLTVQLAYVEQGKCYYLCWTSFKGTQHTLCVIEVIQ